MEAWYSWVQNLVGFFLFMSVIDHLLPGNTYQKYLRLFAGTVLILLVLKPLTGGLRLEEAIARAYESFVFQYQAEDMKKELLGIEAKQLEHMIRRYEESVAADVGQMAQEEGLTVLSCQVTIDKDSGSETYGSVIRIQIGVAGDKAGGENHEARPREGGSLVEPVKPVTIKEERKPEQPGTELSACILRLRRRLEAYYGLEERYVEIQIAGR